MERILKSEVARQLEEKLTHLSETQRIMRLQLGEAEGSAHAGMEDALGQMAAEERTVRQQLSQVEKKSESQRIWIPPQAPPRR